MPLSYCVCWFHIEQVALNACPRVSGRIPRLVVTCPGLDIVMSDTNHDEPFSSPRQFVVFVEYTKSWLLRRYLCCSHSDSHEYEQTVTVHSR
jgi:hypothetical protein